MKPGFYFLAQHGPWMSHVKFKDEDKALEAIEYLVKNGHKVNEDYEMIYEALGAQKGEFKSATVIAKMIPSPNWGGQTVQPRRTAIIFFKDPKIASYIKLSYG